MKLLKLVFVTMLILSMVVSCGKKQEDTGSVESTTKAADDSNVSETEKTTSNDAVATEDQSIVIYQNKVEISEALTNFAAEYEKETGVHVEVKTAGGGTPYADSLLAEFQTDKQPDIFVIGGAGDYELYKNKIMPFEGDNTDWIDLTDLEYVTDGKVYGFPVAVEAWGMGYNAEMLEKAGIDPASLTSLDAYKEAFAKLDSMKEELGIKAVVSLATSTTTGMTWVTGFHNFNGYLSAGLPYGDTTVSDQVLAGQADMERLAEYADWVELLFKYSDQDVLLAGDYDAQVGLFGTQQAAFIHQGNWIDPWLAEKGIDFKMGYAPHASVSGTVDSIFIGAPSFYVLNSESENTEAAKAFLNYMATNEKGHDYMVNQAKMVPAFKNVTLVPNGPLSSDVAKWVAKGKAYTWLQNDMPAGFCGDILGPIYEAFAKGDMTKEQFINSMASAIEDIPNN